MSDAYTRPAKPTGTGYTKVNGPGRVSYDDELVDFDSDIFSFDGGDGSDYIPIAKPTGSPYTKISKPIT